METQNLTAADARRIQIATAVVAGQSITATARQLGISRE
jgi:molybdenum-dependent DNA-binding transcriptional regulator ModE